MKGRAHVALRPIEQLRDRLTLAKGDSDVAAFMTLLFWERPSLSLPLRVWLPCWTMMMDIDIDSNTRWSAPIYRVRGRMSSMTSQSGLPQRLAYAEASPLSTIFQNASLQMTTGG